MGTIQLFPGENPIVTLPGGVVTASPQMQMAGIGNQFAGTQNANPTAVAYG